jgi:hypothetical protein
MPARAQRTQVRAVRPEAPPAGDFGPRPGIAWGSLLHVSTQGLTVSKALAV